MTEEEKEIRERWDTCWVEDIQAKKDIQTLLDLLDGEKDAHKRTGNMLQVKVDELAEANEKWDREREKVRELMEYADHYTHCKRGISGLSCTCGLDKVLKQVGGEE